MSDTTIYTDTITINVNFPAGGMKSGFLDTILNAFQGGSVTIIPPGDTAGDDDYDTDYPAADDTGDAVSFPMTYAAIHGLQEGDRVQWDGTKLQFTGTVVENVYGAYDSDQGKDVFVVRIRRDDTGKVVKLNLASDHRGTLTLLA